MALNEKEYETESLCPVCLRKITATIYTEADNTFMTKECTDHGTFQTVLWRGGIPMEKWQRNKIRAYIKNPITQGEKGCPYDCGLCKEHRQHTCTALIEVTQNCNLHCRFCFADSFSSKEQDPSLENIRFRFKCILEASGACNIQLSGGEPTMRNDLPEIIKIAIEMGFPFIQLNTNGIRLADDEEFVASLKEAGLSSIFLQFDGTQDEIHQKLRGRNLLEKKVRAIENCKKYHIGVVLVPTLVPDVNIDNIGEIIRFGIKGSPTIRGVHFQPVSYFGRIPQIPKDNERITLPEVMTEVSRQTENMILPDSMNPPGCENALCSFHGSYIIENNSLIPKTKRSNCCDSTEQAEEGAKKAKAFVARNWSSKHKPYKYDNKKNISDWDKIIDVLQNKSFSISAMAFQDGWNVDLERIKDCCIHVASQDGRLIPFCMYNLTNIEGRSLYRDGKK